MIVGKAKDAQTQAKPDEAHDGFATGQRRAREPFGRLVVQLRVVVPTNLSNKQRVLLRAFADEMGDDVASGKKSVTDRIKSALDDILD